MKFWTYWLFVSLILAAGMLITKDLGSYVVGILIGAFISNLKSKVV
ncbi:MULTISPECIES: hypothetical protein [unclassified Archaeoglobus]|jgi:hypothetical protein|nr:MULTISPECIES: hypothetical protein [unclassified Archaeoglobus]